MLVLYPDVCPARARTSAKRRWVGQFVCRVKRFVRWKLLRIMPNDLRIRTLRGLGLRIGEHCVINTTSFSTEPYVIEIGNHVAISIGCQFITHDPALWG